MSVAVIGAGSFGGTILAQAAFTSAVRIDVVADNRLDLAREALRSSGIHADRIIACGSAVEARRALERGCRVITESADWVAELEAVEVVVESTGIPEAGARHASAAIAAGKHVAMVNKETDAVVGPILKHLADRAGVVYTAVDGDQHGLLIKLHRWARALGLEIVCGGKALDSEIVYHDDPPRLTRWGMPLAIPIGGMSAFEYQHSIEVQATVARRTGALAGANGAKPWDLVELTIAANATGLVPDVASTHCPALWTTEIPAVMCPYDLGGMLSGPGRIDAVQIVRRPHELTLQGGVFLVVRVQTESMRRIVVSKEAVMHPDGETALIVRPHHLLGIEAIGSIVAAARGGVPTGAIDYPPTFDVVYRAARDLHAGETLGDDHSDSVTAEMVPNVGTAADAPLPSALAQHRILRTAVPAGTLVTLSALKRPAESDLWKLRDLQDAHWPVANSIL